MCEDDYLSGKMEMMPSDLLLTLDNVLSEFLMKDGRKLQRGEEGQKGG